MCTTGYRQQKALQTRSPGNEVTFLRKLNYFCNAEED